MALCPLPTPFPSRVRAGCAEPPRESEMGRGVVGNETSPGKVSPRLIFLSQVLS